MGWLFGDGRSAARLPTGWHSVAASIRRTRDAHGLETGRFGHWLYTARRWITAGGVLLAVLILVLNRPMTIGLIVGGAATIMVALLALSLLWSTGPPAAAPGPEDSREG